MSEERAISGNQGFVKLGSSQVGEITEFSGTVNYGVKTYVAQSSVLPAGGGGVGYQKTVKGNTNLDATITGLFDPNYPIGTILAKGAIIAYILYENYPSAYFSGNCRVDTRTFAANMNTGDPIPFTATIKSDGIVNEVGV